ncbi:MAG: hypothetical protein IJ199_07330 [Prevotella sp.]|nr:hypothetical protein [Prevotella sp.]
MKTNKKALMGMLVAMVMSLGVTGGIQKQAQKSNELSIQQIAAGCTYTSGNTEGHISSGWAACGVAAGLMSAMTGGITGALYLL